MVEVKKRYGLIITGKEPVYFDTSKKRQGFIKKIKDLVTSTTFTSEKLDLIK